ncbi:DUF4263 domain-containing protein [Pseudomonas taiwanensis]|uniref:Shedu anti-phage system protein SduA domain-containing protein n=1 Tax=Pseudomonas taiwanensis TaxID=470150 RepID=UPI0028E051F2|nr:Shedu anti-phage system protein SduA domain-containing protein [Pseudomonas taiwanensis]MDT8924647.1 DUF4263 domain-containing protein [Pseudomonas taiwanensis]
MLSEIKAKHASSQVPEPRNRIKRKGLESQAAKKKPVRSAPPEKPLELTRDEHSIHKMIVDNPFLLHTPELFGGGLYLDSVLNKHRLPCNLIPDFAYITVQDRVIKITLVEIERSVKGVFHSRFGMRSTFRSETLEAINQVREWRAAMENDDMRRALLRNLKPLFQNYPVGIFEPEGHVSNLAKISLGYVLVVGSETVETPIQQQMIDDLYLHEDIIFMTYPMMIERLRAGVRAKNMLKVGPRGVSVETLGAPTQLLSKGPDVGLPREFDTDAYGIKMAGLGWALSGNARRASAVHPASIKQIFYRANGLCEQPGCTTKIIHEGEVQGRLRHLYNGIDELSDVETLSDTDHVLLMCHEHADAFNKGQVFMLGRPHPLNDALKLRRPYRPLLDDDAYAFIGEWNDSKSHPILGALGIDAAYEPELARHVHLWSMAVASLPWQCQIKLSQIVRDYFDTKNNWNIDRSRRYAYSSRVCHYLWRASVIRVNDLASPGKEIEPTVFSKALIDRVHQRFGSRSMAAISALCEANGRRLEDELKRAVKEAQES